MQVRGLGYLSVESTDPEAWRHYGTEVLGAMVAPTSPDDGVHLKIDEYAYRIGIRAGSSDRLACTGWELADAGAFADALAELEAAGIAVEHGTAEEASERRVHGLARCQDPSGNALELYYGPILDHTRFVSPVGVSGFVTGDMGMGHVVLPAPAFQATHEFYTRLGFALTDCMHVPAVAVPGRDPERGPAPIYFYHCNPRHHSLALFEASIPTGLVHMMLEVPDMDEVGYALDRCQAHSVPLSATLGRHANDQMVSFYMRSPTGFDVEFGHGGLRIDPERHTTSEFTKISYWGHQFGPQG